MEREREREEEVHAEEDAEHTTEMMDNTDIHQDDNFLQARRGTANIVYTH